MTDRTTSVYRGSDPTRRPTASILVARAFDRLRAEPVLAVPFALAGIAFTIFDLLRLRDPIPTNFVEGLSEGTVSVAFLVYPTGLQSTALPPGALVDLKLPYLVWAVGLELLALLAVAVAGWLTFSRALGVEPALGRFRSYLGLVVGIRATFALFSPLDDLGLVLGLVLVVVVLSAFVRLFATPALVVAGHPLRTAVGRSWRLSSGHGLSLAALVVLIGLATWALGSVPHVGTFLSFALVAPVHALAVAAFVELAD